MTAILIVAVVAAVFIAAINVRFYRERAAMTPEQLLHDDEEIRRFIQTW